MAHLIDKDALVAEIENLLDKGKYHEEYYCAYRDGNNGALYALKNKLDTLEVKEADLDFQMFAKEMDTVFNLPSSETKNTEEEPLNWEYAIAKHFFELGMAASNKAQKKEPVEKDKLRALSDGKQHLGWLDDAEALENHVSEGLGDYINELSKQFPEVSFAKLSRIAVRMAKWQKENLWKPADGDDLPKYDKEVIAILDYDFGHYKVVYAHRPNPDGWDGTNIDTGEKEHFEPEIYDKGGWNQPHILFWLDARLPYEEK